MKKSYLLLLSAIILFAACGKEEIGGNNTNINNNNNTNNNNTNNNNNTALLDILVGDYHWVGGSSGFAGNQQLPPHSIDDTSAVVMIDDSTLSCRGYNLVLTTPSTPFITFDPNTNTFYVWDGHRMTSLKFNKSFNPLNDTAYFRSTFVSAGGQSTTALKGVKIH